jgi:predicted amidohydrolase YtcJ
MIHAIFFSLLTFFSLFHGNKTMKTEVDLIVTNATIYTVDSLNPRAEALAVLNGRIVATGTTKSISERYEAVKTLDLKGKFVYPGFIDAHCHFYGYALGLQYVDLFDCKSFQEVLARLKSAGDPGPGKWLVGRGWDQNLWPEKTFPDNRMLNETYRNIPVMLIRVDGHVVLANREALTRAGIGLENKFGKQVEIRNGKLTGILSETAADLMRETVPEPSGTELVELLRDAQDDCFNVGLTMVSDAGLEAAQIRLIDSLQKNDVLKIHIYGMLTPTPATIREFVLHGPYFTEKLTVRSIKVYADGSLGSRTARLKYPYTDDPSTSGIIVTSPDSIRTLCGIAHANGYQVNTHCIGDSANRLVLDIYSSFLKGPNDLRWRIEHAQVLDPDDIPKFGTYSVIPSVQATHATSDMKWAGDRLGLMRIQGAYAYQSLLLQNGWIANGTDFPIENISPLLTFYASVARQDVGGYPENGFRMEEALSREDALRSVTIWAAKAGFLEKTKGSLEAGKDADFVVLDQDIMEIIPKKIPDTKVLETFISGKSVLIN